MVKNAGFNAIRIPCAWNSYMEDASTAKLKESWLNRVQEVVDYCFTNDMYVVINIHWDGGWLEENPLYSKQDEINDKQKAFWEQIAVHFRDYDEHLLFAGTNEVHANYNTPSTENIEVQQSFNQTFVDAVRSTGGKNAYRTLIVQAYNTNIDYAYDKMSMPSDEAPNRLIAEVHYYDPWDFCGAQSSDNSATFFWGNEAGYTNISGWGQEDHARRQFAKMKSKFVDKGIPVIMGEYGAVNRTASLVSEDEKELHRQSRAYYLKYVTQKMKENGIVPFYWDNGHTGKDGFALFDRNTKTVFDQQALDALIEGAGAGNYPQ
jgi:endoglucanase